MKDRDTTLGGALRGFETTQWSQVARAQDGHHDLRRKALEELLRRYWKPVYAYIRLQWNRSNEDSKDLTQEFFAWLLESDALQQIQKERGRFRTFIRVALRNFLSNEYEAGKAVKRGGGRTIVSLQELEAAGLNLPSSAANPEAALDREWKRALLEQALDALREDYRAVDKLVSYQVFEAYYFALQAEPSHADLAAKFGLSLVDVNNILADARERFRRHVYTLVSELVTDAEGFRVEVHDLFGNWPDL